MTIIDRSSGPMVDDGNSDLCIKDSDSGRMMKIVTALSPGIINKVIGELTRG